jgi:hypothetical protein
MLLISALSSAVSANMIFSPIDQLSGSKRGDRVSYYGGPVISNVKVVTVFWGSYTDAEKKTIETYYQQVTNSTYMDYLSEYSTPTQTIGRGTWIGSYHETAKPASEETLNQKLIEGKLQSLIDQGKVPKYDKDTYYAMHLGGWGKGINYFGMGACRRYMALHCFLRLTQFTLSKLPKIMSIMDLCLIVEANWSGFLPATS